MPDFKWLTWLTLSLLASLFVLTHSFGAEQGCEIGVIGEQNVFQVQVWFPGAKKGTFLIDRDCWLGLREYHLQSAISQEPSLPPVGAR